MGLALTNAFDILLAPHLVDVLNDLDLHLKMCATFAVNEDDFTSDSYELATDIPAVPVGEWPSPEVEGRYCTTSRPPITLTNESEETAWFCGGFILTQGESGTDALAYLPTPEIILMHPGDTITVSLKVLLSDKYTPEP